MECQPREEFGSSLASQNVTDWKAEAADADVDVQFYKLVKPVQLPLGGGLLVQLSELLHDGGHVGQPLPHLRRGSSPGEVSEAPGPRLSLAVDVGHLPLPLSAHDELGVVLEVVDLEEGFVVTKKAAGRAGQWRARSGWRV